MNDLKYYNFNWIVKLWIMLVFTFGLSANIFILIIHRKFICQKNYDFFQSNLVISNLLYLILVFPSNLYTIICSKWIFGDHFCWLSGYFSLIYFGGTMLGLAACIFERFHSLKSPTKSFKTKLKSIFFLMFIWVSQGLLLLIFHLFFSKQKVSFSLMINCKPSWNTYENFTAIWIFISYVYPLAVILFCGIFILLNDYQKLRRVSSDIILDNAKVSFINSKLEVAFSSMIGDDKEQATNESTRNLSINSSRSSILQFEDASNDIFSPHSPIHEKINEVATAPFFSYSQLEENSNCVQIDSMNSVETLNEEVRKKSSITSVKKHFKKKLVKFILFLFLFLIITIPFIVTLIIKSRNIKLSERLVSVASVMFYSIPAFVSTFLISSDVNLKRNFYNIFTCKKKTTLDKRYLQATTGDLQNLSEILPTFSKRDTETPVCVKWKGKNKIKIAWPSLSDEASSNRSDVDDVQSFHCTSSSVSISPFDFVEGLKVVYRSSSFNESFIESKNNLVKKIRPSSMPAEILKEEELNHELL